MRFGPVDIADKDTLRGAVLAHAAKLDDGKRLKKGTVLHDIHVDALRRSGFQQVTVAVPDKGDILENEAAGHIAAALPKGRWRMDAPTTGRVNIFAEVDGVLTFDGASLNDLNMVDPAITIATLPAMSRVSAGQMIATVKIIAFAVDSQSVAGAVAAAKNLKLGVHAFCRGLRVSLLQTRLKTVKEAVLDKTRSVTEARLQQMGLTLGHEIRCGHSVDALAQAIAPLAAKSDLLLIFGASAVSDGDDVIPAAIRQADGEIESVGMPVDPGNLLVLGGIGLCAVIGAPGCARSSKLNGFDWVLERLVAGLPVTRADIVAMGAGGLLTEIETRPQPRISRP